MEKIPNHTALKEWAAVISALESGDQILLLRKGGIADARFGMEASRFLLFPTYLHQREKQFQPQHRGHFTSTDSGEGEPESVRISSWAEIVELFRLDDLERLRALERFLIFTDATIEERFRFRSDQAVHVIALRTHTLREPVVVLNQKKYSGCRSWISLDEEIDITGSTAVLTDAEITARVAAIAEVARHRHPKEGGL